MDKVSPRVGVVERWGSVGAAARVAVLAVHGRGHNPDVMREYSSRFGLDGLAFFAPHAPGDSWYPQSFLVPFAVNADGLEGALRAVDDCLAQIAAEGFAPGNVLLWGFSQGACVLSHYLLVRRPVVGGAVLFTGGFVGEEPLEVRAGSDLVGLPVIVRSIENDPFVPAWRVAQTVSLLEALGADVDLGIDPGHDHVITDEAFATAAGLLEQMGATSIQRLTPHARPRGITR